MDVQDLIYNLSYIKCRKLKIYVKKFKGLYQKKALIELSEARQGLFLCFVCQPSGSGTWKIILYSNLWLFLFIYYILEIHIKNNIV